MLPILISRLAFNVIEALSIPVIPLLLLDKIEPLPASSLIGSEN